MHRVFILHWNSPEQCLATVRRFEEQNVPLSITVIDNASTPELIERLRTGLPRNISVLVHPHNMGWGAGFNPALREWIGTKPEGYAFISAHDALPEPGCLKMLVEALDRNADIGLASPEYGQPDLPTFRAVRGARLVRGEARPPGKVERFPYAHGTLMAARCECLAEIGTFDERFFAYGDELEICLRASRRGWANAIVWGAVVINPGSGTPSALMAYLWTRNLLLIARIYGGRMAASARAASVLATTGMHRLTGRSQRSLSSPYARLRAVNDYLHSRFGAPRPDLVLKLKSL
jgi:GT2 family glycosyltransferase